MLRPLAQMAELAPSLSMERYLSPLRAEVVVALARAPQIKQISQVMVAAMVHIAAV
jgi:hypothetical protein